MHDDANEPAINNADRAIGDAHASTNAHTGRNSHSSTDGNRDGYRTGISDTHRIGHVNADGCSDVDEHADVRPFIDRDEQQHTSEHGNADGGIEYGDTGDANYDQRFAHWHTNADRDSHRDRSYGDAGREFYPNYDNHRRNVNNEAVEDSHAGYVANRHRDADSRQYGHQRGSYKDAPGDTHGHWRHGAARHR